MAVDWSLSTASLQNHWSAKVSLISPASLLRKHHTHKYAPTKHSDLWVKREERLIFLFTHWLLGSASVFLLPAGLAVWAAALEGRSQPREPNPVGKPVHDPSFPQPVASRARFYLWTAEQHHDGTAAVCRQTHTDQQWKHTGEAT